MMSELQSETYTCPICLGENQVIYPAPDEEENVDRQRMVTQDGNPIFELTSCDHKFCAACLRAYVRSKLLDGEVDVPCCHFKLSSNEEDFQPCNILIQESDIHQLLHMNMDMDECVEQCSGDNKDKYACLCCEKGQEDDTCHSSCKPKENGENGKEGGGDELWKKFKKLKFDAHHGKDTVRRCPKCDEARLFDQKCMKQYQSKHLTQNNSTSTTNDESDIPAGNMSRLGRAVNLLFRQRERDSGAFPSATASASGSNERVGSANLSPEVNDISQEKEPTKPDDVPSGGASDPPSTPIGNEGDACNSLDEKDSDGSIDSKAETKQNEALVKSTTPTVTCHNCDTEFCYFHSNAHSGKSCIEYHKQTLEMDRTNTEYASRILRAKPCPNCGISVSKEGGCNQIKCGNCGTHFCWLCSKIVDDGAFPEHFRWWNLTGCANMQLDENNEPLRCTIIGAKLLSALQILVLGIPALALTVVSMVLCPCLVPGCGSTNRERVINCISFWGSFLSSLLLLPFTCVGMLILSALYCFLAFVAFFFKLLTAQAGKHRASSNSNVVGGNSSSRAVDLGGAPGDSGNAAPNDDLIRELENIFERMEAIEEGRSHSNSHD